jgi:hypothetical protein
MASILISNGRLLNEKDYRLVREITIRLTNKGHEVLNSDIEVSHNSDSYFKNQLYEMDVFIPIISDELLKYDDYYNEILQIRNYTSHIEGKLILPVLTPGADIDSLPDSLVNTRFYKLEDESPKSLDALVRKIDESINMFLGRKIASEEKAKEFKEKIEHTASEYITETIGGLEKREKHLRRLGFWWYFIGLISIVFGAGAAIWFSNNGWDNFQGKENWSMTTFYAIKCFLIIAMLIAASKYSFNLGKSYMGESLKVSDRVHAISYGKFYLQVFDQQINSSELKDIFRDWNINNQANAFSSTTTNDFDPKFVEKLVEIIEKVRKKEI